MKKVLFIVVICLVSLHSLAEISLATTPNFESLEIQQSSNWEYLGDIVGVTNGGATIKARLYYRAIGERDFFQVRYKLSFIDKDEKTSSVSIGSYLFREKKYNAKFEVENSYNNFSTYYFNL